MRLLAASWLLLGLVTLLTRGLVSVVLFRHLEYTLDSVLELSLLPPLQALALVWAAQGVPVRAGLKTWGQALSSWAARSVWVVELAAVAGCAWLGATGAAPAVGLRRFLELLSGVALAMAAGLLVAAGRRASRGMGRLFSGALACALGGALCLVAAAGLRPHLAVPLSPALAAVWLAAVAVSLPLLLRAARVLGRAAALPLETAAVLAAASAVAVPPGLYLRPYLGSAWLDPGRVCLLLAAGCCLTAALAAARPGAVLTPPERASFAATSPRSWLLLWLVLQVSYLAGWATLRYWLGESFRPSLESATVALLLPLLQTLLLWLWRPRSRREVVRSPG